jgi:HAMP domain-containing protein
MVLALAAEEITFWQAILVVGAIVIIAVIALLGLLLYLVRSIEASVQRLGSAAQGVANNTGNIKIALAVAASLDEVAEEAGRHAQLLGVGR